MPVPFAVVLAVVAATAARVQRGMRKTFGTTLAFSGRRTGATTKRVACPVTADTAMT